MPKKTFEAAAQAQARVIIQLKDNQPSLLQNVEAACASRNPTSSDTEVTTGRCRHETRTAEIFRATAAVADGRLYIRGERHLYCIGKGR